MPEISRFYGIKIRMYPNDHWPPHFHAYYRGKLGRVGIKAVEILDDGGLPTRAIWMIQEWAALHEAELMENWRALRAGRPAKRIEPLE